ncbi:unnamed protein product [Rotaria sordida]|uniref:Nuclear receptor domain-containing protein n=1 Tax=Rotaria sordida TaxID=392033 RepID=A0A815LX16_9BILA|nr:unnamed protein product [Rotaria sordida]CAF3830564.1 unnamed protein product [Rotaria sordida]
MDDQLIENWNDTTQYMNLNKKPKKIPLECKICGAPAFYSYVSVIVCFSCKMFFKRNAETKQEHSKCLFDGHCQINTLNRHNCSSCRLAKCFKSGMQVAMLRSSRTTKNKTKQQQKVTKISTVLARLKEIDHTQQLPTLNLLQSDQLTLTMDEWNLLSHLTHCYDEYNGFSLVQRFIHEQNNLPPKMRYRLTRVNELILSFINQSQYFYETNSYFISLCSHDRRILVHNTMKYVGSLGACFIIHHTGLLNNLAFYKSIEIIYGSSILTNSNRIICQFNFDDTFFKLVLPLLIFSTFDYTYYTNIVPINLMDIKTILHIQNIYTELAWRYLICRYNYRQAVINFSNLIRYIFSLNNTIVEAIELKQCKDMVDLVIEQTKKTTKLID